MSDAITIKGISQGILLTLNEDAPWDEVLAGIEKLIDGQAAFFKGGQVVLDTGALCIAADDLRALMESLDTRNVKLAGVLGEDDTTCDAAAELDLPTQLDDIEPPPLPPRPEDQVASFDSEVYGTAGVLIKQTVRSGRTVRSSGHVIVIGDVNSGAEIVAIGDIIVWGKVRGTVHAGAQGDESAVVCALDLMPMQLRIASKITIPPQEKSRRRRNKVSPEMAYISDDGQIEAAPWSAKG